MRRESALYRQLLVENMETLEGFRVGGAVFRQVQEVLFLARFCDRETAIAARRELRERHDFSNEDLVFTKNVPGNDTEVDCAIAVNIPIEADAITYFESLLKDVGSELNGWDYSWEIQP